MTTATATPVADAIRAMQDRLGRPEWWCKGEYERGQARCLSGALGLAVGGVCEPSFWAVRDLLTDVLAAWTCVEDWPALSSYNDRARTTHDDILLFLDAALDVAESEGL